VVDPPGRSTFGAALDSFFFLGSLDAWAVVHLGSSDGAGNTLAVVRTTNGGRSWRRGPTLAPLADLGRGLPPHHQMEPGPASLWFVNPTDGWLTVSAGEAGTGPPPLVGTGRGMVLYHTTDGGTHWLQELRFTVFTRSAGGLPATCGTPAPVFTTRSVGFAVGGCVAVTHSAGRTWSVVQMPRPPSATPAEWRRAQCNGPSPSFPTASVGWIGLECTWHTPAGRFRDVELSYETNDGGQIWALRPNPIYYPELPPTYTTPDTPGTAGRAWLLGTTFAQVHRHTPVVGAGSRRLFRSGDGGRQWTLVDSALPAQSLDFVSPTVGFASRGCFGASIGCTQPLLLETGNGGVTWTPIHPRLVAGHLHPLIPYM